MRYSKNVFNEIKNYIILTKQKIINFKQLNFDKYCISYCINKR